MVNSDDDDDDDDDDDVSEFKLSLNLYESSSDTNSQTDFGWNDSDFMPGDFQNIKELQFATILYLIYVYQQKHQKWITELYPVYIILHIFHRCIQSSKVWFNKRLENMSYSKKI